MIRTPLTPDYKLPTVCLAPTMEAETPSYLDHIIEKYSILYFVFCCFYFE